MTARTLATIVNQAERTQKNLALLAALCTDGDSASRGVAFPLAERAIEQAGNALDTILNSEIRIV